ncbi:MAG: lysophospholipid acyltransferase family protein [Pseudomonadota bacterium]
MRSLVFNVLFYAYSLVMAGVLILLSAFGAGPNTARGMLRAHAKGVLFLTRTILSARLEIRGKERYAAQGGPQLIVSKHQSELDPFMLFVDHPELAAIAMEELARYPLIGPVVRKLGYIQVSVEGAKLRQLRQVIEGSRAVAAEGRPILIYPEGELMRVGSRQRYKTGVFHIYEATGYAATPVALSCGLVWPKREWTKHAGQTAVLEYLEPIPPGLDKERFMAEIERRIEEGSMALLREHADPATLAIAEERHAKGLTNEDDVTVAELEADAVAAAADPTGAGSATADAAQTDPRDPAARAESSVEDGARARS